MISETHSNYEFKKSGFEDVCQIDSGFDSCYNSMQFTSSLCEEKLKTYDLSESFMKNVNIHESEYSNIDVKNQLMQEPYEYYFEQDEEGDTQLHISVAHNLVPLSLYVISIASDSKVLDILNFENQTALHIAVLTRQADVVRQLIIAGANPDIRNDIGNTALHIASRYGDVECIRALIQPLSTQEKYLVPYDRSQPCLPSNLENRNYEGAMSIHLAAIHDNVDAMRALVFYGANLEAQEGYGGRTALHLAIEQQSYNVLKFLLKECRPNLNSRMYDGCTPYRLATYVNRDVADILVQWGADPISESEGSESEESDSDME